MSLTQYFHQNRGLPINKWVHYFSIYERFFAPFRNKSILFLEIGTGQGGSSQMWKHYFGPSARILTCDIRSECKNFEDEQVSVRVGDQSDCAFLQSLIDEFGAPDIVLDDGSHIMKHVLATFEYLFPRCAREAVYIVEDMHTAYWPSYGGGLRSPESFIEVTKALVDEINSYNPHHASQQADRMPTSPISEMIRGISFYPSMVVVEKGPFINKSERSIPLIEGATVW